MKFQCIQTNSLKDITLFVNEAAAWERIRDGVTRSYSILNRPSEFMCNNEGFLKALRNALDITPSRLRASPLLFMFLK